MTAGAFADAKADVAKVNLLILQATSFCNIDCRYCYLADRSAKRRMSADTLEALISALIRDELLGDEITINWHAGEPLVVGVDFYRQAAAQLRRLECTGTRVVHSVQTNGMLIDEAWCAFFRDYDIRVGVSIDGPQWLHDKHRLDRQGRGTFERAMSGLNHLRAAGVPFSVITVLTNDSVDRPDELYDFYVEHDVRVVGFNIEETEGVNLLSSIARPDFAARFAAFLSRIQERADADNKVRVRELDHFRRRVRERAEPRNDQTIPFSILTVTTSGNFSTFSPELIDVKSERLTDFILGNVRGGIRAALETAKFRTLHEEIAAGVRACLAECPYFALCGGPPGMATVTRDPRSGLLVGLHVDTFEAYNQDRTSAGNRLSINIGLAPRYFLFVPYDFRALARAGNLSQASSVVRRFFESQSAAPVVRVRINPGEAYIAPTEAIIHDASSSDGCDPDLHVTALGCFEPQA
jgi:uncharacterized protein